MNMREAWGKWVKRNSYRFSCADCEEASQAAFEAGYAAAIEAVKAGGVVAWHYVWDKGDDVWMHKLNDEALFDFVPNPHTCTELYKLPEDV